MDNDKSTPTKGFVQVYKSTDSVPCEPWFAPADAVVAYPFIVDKPDASLKAPKYDWANKRWFETDSATTGQQIADIKDLVKSFNDKNNKNYDAVNKQIGSIVNLISALPVDDSADSAKEGSGR